MKSYLKFSKELWQRIDESLENSLKLDPEPVAVFDADGTLWDTDLGESFFKYEIAQGYLSNLPPDPWKHYRAWKNSGDPRPAYLWLAQIHEGLELTQVRAWTQEAVKKNSPLPIFEDQQRLVEKLQSLRFKIYIVTASVKWAVEPGAKALGLSEDCVIGVETRVENGVITADGIPPITYREGKLEALLQKTSGKKPSFACGNTLGDSTLLLNSTALSLAVGAASQDQELFAAEEQLRDLARQNGWPIHRF